MCNFWPVFFSWIFSKVFARAEVKHTIYFDWPKAVIMKRKKDPAEAAG